MNVTLKPPPKDQLRRYLLGTLPPADFRRVESWVESDPHSVAHLNTISASDSVTQALATPRPAAWNSTSTDSLARAVERALAAGSNATVDPDGTFTDVTLRPGADLGLSFGDYRAVKEIGSGGMGVVYEAVDGKLGRKVAVKVLGRDLLAKPEHRERFFREARIVAALRSDHVVTIHQVGEADGRPYMVMELLPGSTLDAWLKAKGRTPSVAEIARIVRELLTGLADAHRAGLIHRDIKPANLWVEERTGRLKVIDFGLGRAVSDTDGHTQPGAILGTPSYMAPEQAKGKPADTRADLFSAGVVAYRMFAGRSPFQKNNPTASLAALLEYKDDLPRPAGVPDAVWAFMQRLLSKSPDGRPADATVALREWQRIEPALLAPPAPPARRSRGRIAAAFGSVAAALTLAAIILIWRDGKVQVVVAPDTGKVTVESTEKGTSVVVTPEPAPKGPPPPQPPVVIDPIIGKRVTVNVDLTTGFDGKTGDLPSGHQPMRGDKGTVREVANVGNRWRVVWDTDKAESQGCWVYSGCLEIEK